MASYHCHVKVGAKGKAGPHADYILREGKYENAKGLEELEASGSGNMPKWAEHKPSIFWKAADEHERANGSTYREIEVALPRELTPPQRLALVNDFLERAFGKSHAHTFAIHNPKSALDGGEQPHAHIMYSERVLDGIDRDPSQFFKRYNAKSPEKGGCKKDSAGTEERLQQTRELWAEVQNEHLERLGHNARVDHRSLKEQGIQRAPQRHIPRKDWAALTEIAVTAILERRAAEGELERAQRIVSFIDVSGDLQSAIKERELKAQAAAKAKAEREAEARAEAKEQAAKSWDLMKSVISQPVVAPPQPRQWADVSGDLQSALRDRKDEFKRAASKANAGLQKPHGYDDPPSRDTRTSGGLQKPHGYDDPPSRDTRTSGGLQKPHGYDDPPPRANARAAGGLQKPHGYDDPPKISVADGMANFRAQFDAAKLQAERQKAEQEQERQAKEREAQQRQAKLREQSRSRNQGKEYKPRGPTR